VCVCVCVCVWKVSTSFTLLMVRWCVQYSNGEVRWCVQYSIHQGRSDYDFLLNSFVFLLLEIFLLYPMPLHKTFCLQGRITLQTPRQDGLPLHWN
jgi:hypothetical protein